ncbi:hypothetical protein [Bradyrhizobium archetypum]|uniref:Uncharacterized protein n=1 Tax=Bradyrhizobium archetypum TaxID=2721160 RepID=A0A7Y4M0F9_9BRAD|nr:hypothetical protein [Bradyrhizobium archetypum]NOJ44820.1 hypothetical protein [Bradyrhizobium archetypum]
MLRAARALELLHWQPKAKRRACPSRNSDGVISWDPQDRFGLGFAAIKFRPFFRRQNSKARHQQYAKATPGDRRSHYQPGFAALIDQRQSQSRIRAD